MKPEKTYLMKENEVARGLSPNFIPPTHTNTQQQSLIPKNT